MKKSLFGYNVDEVNELMDSLQSQNDTLTQKIANLTLQLTEAESNGGEEKMAEAAKKMAEADKKIDELKKKNTDLEIALRNASEGNKANGDAEKLNSEIAKLKNENIELQKKLASGSSVAESQHDEESRIGNLFQTVYSNCENIQSDIVKDMQERVDKYGNAISEYNEKMNEVLDSTKARYREMVQNFSGELAAIFEALDMINTGTEAVQSEIKPTEEITNELREKIDSIIRKNQQQMKENLGFDRGEDDTAGDDSTKVEISPVLQLLEKYFNKNNGDVSATTTKR